MADAIVAHEEPDAERIVHRSASAAGIDDQDDARPGGEVRRDLVVDVVGPVVSIDGIGTPMSGPALRTRVRYAVFPMRDSKSEDRNDAARYTDRAGVRASRAAK